MKPCYADLMEERVAAVLEAVGPNVDIIMENHSFLECSQYALYLEAMSLQVVQTDINQR